MNKRSIVLFIMIFYCTTTLAQEDRIVDSLAEVVTTPLSEIQVQDEQLKKETQLLCTEVIKYPRRGRGYSFSNNDVKNPCSPLWKDSNIPYWQEPENKETINSVNTSRWTPPTQEEFLKQPGVKLASPEENRKFTERVLSLRNDVIGPCCGDNQECRRAMESTEPIICSNPDPKQLDRCYSSPGFYMAAGNQWQQYVWNSIKVALESGVLTSNDTQFYRQQLESLKPHIDPNLRNKVIPGQVVLSPYLYNGDRPIGEQAIRHEFGHACSDIKRQLSAYRGNLGAAFSMIRIFRDPSDSLLCSMHTSYEDAFKSIFSAMENGSKIGRCLFKIAQESANRASQAFQADGCPMNKLEEGIGLAFEMIASASTYRNPDALCWGIPSAKHPHSSHVLECLLQHSPQFRSQLEKSLLCKKAEK